MLKKGKSDQLSYGQKLLVNDLTKYFCNTGKIEQILPILECKSSISLRLIDWFVTNYSKKYGISYSLSEYELKHKNFPNYTLGKKKKISPIKSKFNNLIDSDILNKDNKNTNKNTNDNKDTKDNNNDNKENLNQQEDENLNQQEDENLNQQEEENLNQQEEENLNQQEDDMTFNDLFFVYNDYRRQLKSYNKKSFDVFRRDGSFDFYYTEKHSIETNEGQLNFFRWALKNYIIDYIYEHLDDIEKDMNDRTGKTILKTLKKSPKKPHTIATDKFIDKEKTSKSRKKRTELSESSLRKVHKINSPTIISFK